MDHYKHKNLPCQVMLGENVLDVESYNHGFFNGIICVFVPMCIMFGLYYMFKTPFKSRNTSSDFSTKRVTPHKNKHDINIAKSVNQYPNWDDIWDDIWCGIGLVNNMTKYREFINRKVINNNS